MGAWKGKSDREKWDIIDSFYLKQELSLDQLLELLGLEQEQYLKLRKNNLPLPGENFELFMERSARKSQG